MSACREMLKYRPQARHDEGPKIFTGHPADFKLWEFHTKLKAQLARSEESKAPKYVTEVMKGLGEEAQLLARDIGVEELCKKEGIEKLIERMKTVVFPTYKAEASQLYQIGHEKGGILCRHVSQNEPMASYIERRTLWWKLMKEYDTQVSISEEIRGNQLLENSGLSRDQQNMILVSTQNKLDFDSVKDALIAQHGIAHMSSQNYHARHQPQGRTAIGYQRPWGKGRGKDTRAGYIAESQDDGQDQEEYLEDYEDYGDTADDYAYDDDYEYEYE